MISFKEYLNEELKKISPFVAQEKGYFGPVYHGTTQSNLDQIMKDGFKVFVGGDREGNIRHGYPTANYHNNIPAPIHHLGYGIYFTTVKAIGKKYNENSTKGLYEYYIKANKDRIATINFGSAANMMKWWIDNGYDAELAKTGDAGRVKATIKLTNELKKKYDIVWFKGKGIHKLLDGDQIVVFNPKLIYMGDSSLIKNKEGYYKGAIVKRKSDGMVGMITDVRDIGFAIDNWVNNGNTGKHWASDSSDKKSYTVKWKKGGTEFNIIDSKIEKVEGK
jgi:uncharacterized protein YebE (UPF0316 family)